MDHKKRLQAVFIILVLITYGIWQFGPEEWQRSAFPMSFRITALFGILLLAFDDVKKLLLKLNGPTGILIGIGLLMAVVYKPSAKAILPPLIVCIAVLSILGFIRRQFGKD
jgi:high-affinity Fe2+/Pb2+ permease